MGDSSIWLRKKGDPRPSRKKDKRVPEGKVRIEIDPEGILGKGKIEFCPRGMPEVGVEPTRGVSPTGF